MSIQELIQALYLTGSVGASIATGLPHDGLWYQQTFPHQFETTDFAYRGGVGVKLGEHWRIEGEYVRLGNVESTSQFVWDANYNAQTHTCLAQCTQPNSLKSVTMFHGMDVSLSYRWKTQYFEPFVKLGGMMLWHQNRVDWYSQEAQQWNVLRVEGIMPGIMGGVGVCHKMLCGEVLVYQGLATTQNPISTQFIVPQITLQLDWGAWK